MKIILMKIYCAAKQSRMGDTTMCYMRKQSILIERSPKADCKNNLMKNNAWYYIRLQSLDM